MRDVALTMSLLQSLAVPVNADLGATNSTSTIPNPPAAESQPSGDIPLAAGLDWIVSLQEATVVPIQVEGRLISTLQFSTDSGATFNTVETEVIATADPALAASGKFRRIAKIGRRLLDDYGIRDGALVRFKTVYTTTGRVMGDAAATVKATSYLTREAAE